MNKIYNSILENIENPCIVISGPGCGKTTLITKKVQHLCQNGFNIENILCLTFSNKSSSDMTKKIREVSSEKFLAYTFHSFCLEIILKYEKYISEIDRDFEVLTEDFGLLFFIENFEKLNISSFEIKNNSYRICYDLYHKIMSLKENGISIKDIEKLNYLNINLKMDLLSSYLKYEEYKQKNNLVDFCDLINLTIKLFEKNDFILNEIRQKYKYILIDEFQDTNLVQLNLIKLLAKNNITIVLDRKQSIYSFRGSNYENLEIFEKHFENHKKYFLGENFRSSKKVVQNLNLLIEKEFSKDEILISKKEELGEFRIIELEDENSQNEYLLFLVKDFLKKDTSKTFAILTRTNNEAKNIFDYMSLNKIKVNFKSQKNIIENSTANLIFNILKIIKSPKESNNEFFYILERYLISNTTIRNLFRKIESQEKSFFEVLKNLDFSDYEKTKNIIVFLDDFKTLKFLKENIIDLIEFYRSNFDITNLITYLCEKFKFFEEAYLSEDNKNMKILREIIKFSIKFVKIKKNNSFEEFLNIFKENYSVFYGEEKVKSNIIISTIHNSKGLEYDFVVVPNLVDNIYPIKIKQNIFDEKQKNNIDEEKRIFFVALSRAKENLYLITYNKLNNSNVIQSDFLNYFKVQKEKIKISKNIKIQDTKLSIKKEIIKKINFNLLNDNLDIVKSEVKLFETLFSKNNDLKSHILSHPRLDYYKKKIENSTIKKSQVLESLETEKYSHSKISTYMSCPKKYLYETEYKIPTKSKSYFDFGTTLHFVLETITKLDWNKSSKKDLFLYSLEILTDNWISQGYKDYKEEEIYKKSSIKIIENFINKNFEILKEQTPKNFEERFEININGKKISGIIDRVDITNNGDLIILDYKTSKSKKSQKELLDDRQLYIYAIACKTLFGKYPKKMGLWFLCFNEILYVDFDEFIKNKVQNILGR